ncbi:MAG TPA: hypothetical protein VEX62_13050, partial [Candidatus Limnocylindrales bacterium]|nr:hypothetical protein [Candidatus Limnocylindrales bacterium]
VEMGHKGGVGPHSFLDTYADPGIVCSYTTIVEGDPWRGKLAHIDVNAPSLKAILGEQLVGWRFIVRRYRDISKSGETHSVNDPFTVVYRSPIQKATATDSVVADFDPMGVDVTVPAGTLTRNWGYMVIVKSFWYRANGDRQGFAKDRLLWYGIEGSSFTHSSMLWCQGRMGITSG